MNIIFSNFLCISNFGPFGLPFRLSLYFVENKKTCGINMFNDNIVLKNNFKKKNIATITCSAMGLETKGKKEIKSEDILIILVG